MRIALATAVMISAAALTGCSGQISTLDAKDAAGKRLVYPISAADADRVVSQAMVATFPDTPIVEVSLPKKGYMATISFLMDSHRITATATPTTGTASDGASVSAYAFEVAHYGSIPLTGSKKAAAVYEDINRQAAAIAAPIPAASGAK